MASLSHLFLIGISFPIVIFGSLYSNCMGLSYKLQMSSAYHPHSDGQIEGSGFQVVANK